MPAGSRKDVLPAHARIQWRQAGHAARRRAQPGLQRVRPSWPARRFNACAMSDRVRVRAITPSRPFLFGYNKISFSIQILQVKFMDKFWPKIRWGLVNQNGGSSFFNQRRVPPSDFHYWKPTSKSKHSICPGTTRFNISQHKPIQPYGKEVRSTMNSIFAPYQSF